MDKYELDIIGYDSAEEMHEDEEEFNVKISQIESMKSTTGLRAIVSGEEKNIEAWCNATGFPGLLGAEKVA